jgi:hypothetical protein
MIAPPVRPVTVLEPQIRQLVAGRLTRLFRPAGLLSRSKPGALLWVREPFWLAQCYNHVSPSQAAARGALPNFVADFAPGRAPRDHCKRRFARELLRAWHRQHLIVRAVTIVRLQTLSGDDLVSQGFTTREAFAAAWDRNLSLTASGAEWDRDPEVLRLDFEHVDAPIQVLRPTSDCVR